MKVKVQYANMHIFPTVGFLTGMSAPLSSKAVISQAWTNSWVKFTHTFSDSSVLHCAGVFFLRFHCSASMPSCFLHRLVAGASSSFCGGGATLEQPPFDSTYLSVSRLYSVHAACFKLGHQTRGKAMTCSCICHWISVVSLLLGKQTASGQL